MFLDDQSSSLTIHHQHSTIIKATRVHRINNIKNKSHLYKLVTKLSHLHYDNKNGSQRNGWSGRVKSALVNREEGKKKKRRKSPSLVASTRDKAFLIQLNANLNGIRSSFFSSRPSIPSP